MFKWTHFLDSNATSIKFGEINLLNFWNKLIATYSRSHKTVNASENFWNVYCFATNQMRDETTTDNRQTAAGISHDLIRNNELAFSSTRNLQFPLDLSEKATFCPQTNTSPLIPSVQKPIYRRKFTTVQVSVMGEGFLAPKKIRIENHQSQLTSMTF